jgi:hypothetical protein
MGCAAVGRGRLRIIALRNEDQYAKTGRVVMARLVTTADFRPVMPKWWTAAAVKNLLTNAA